MEGVSEGRRPVGRPRMQWQDYMKKDLRHPRQLGVVDPTQWKQMAQDRGKWHHLVMRAKDHWGLQLQEWGNERQNINHVKTSIKSMLGEASMIFNIYDIRTYLSHLCFRTLIEYFLSDRYWDSGVLSLCMPVLINPIGWVQQWSYSMLVP